jgi:hypothetical protein
MGRSRGLLIVLIAIVGAACGGGPPNATPTPVATATPAPASATPKPAAASYEQYFVAACAAWDSLFRAVGNPDTGSGSDLSRSLDEAVTAADVASADRLAADIAKELKVGRGHVAVAGGWTPRAPVMVQLDRVFAAFEVMIEAKRVAAKHEPNAVVPQTAFEQAGGVEAWIAMFEAARAAGGGRAADARCPNVPVTP